LKYRPEIDGLRAVAVIPVILFHAGFDFFNGGFVGVDVFFVISGYLITTIIIEDIEKKSFSVIDFYERRARRILPALIFTLILMSFLSWLFLPTQIIRNVFQQLVSNAFFISNVHYTLTWGYFDSWMLPPIFLNSWSLAIEEQFYLIIPLFLIFFQKKIRFVVVTLICFSLISILCMNLLEETHPKANYYFLPSRLWELSTGVLLAYFMRYKVNQVSKIHQILPSWIGLLLFFSLISIFIGYNDKLPYPSNWTIPLVLLTALMILIIEQKSFVGKILSNNLIVYIGKLSYPLYLLHFPIIILSKHIFLPRFETWQIGIFSLLCSFLISTLVYHYIEYFFRSKKIFKKRFTMLLSSICTLLIIAFVGLMGHLNYVGGFQLKKFPELSHLNEKDPLPSDLSMTDCAARNASTECELINNKNKLKGTKKILIIGDSFAGDLVGHFWKILKDTPNLDLSARIIYACSYMPYQFHVWNGECRKAREYVDKLDSSDVTDLIFHVNFEALNSEKQSKLKNLQSLTKMFDGLIERGVNIHLIGHRDLFTISPVRAFLYPWLRKEFKLKEEVLILNDFYKIWEKKGINIYKKKTKITKLDEAYKLYSDQAHLSYSGSIDFLNKVGIDSSEDLLKIK
jgi:peptidoglycan/LPS O-acetylase OafA/YrhL